MSRFNDIPFIGVVNSDMGRVLSPINLGFKLARQETMGSDDSIAPDANMSVLYN